MHVGKYIYQVHNYNEDNNTIYVVHLEKLDVNGVFIIKLFEVSLESNVLILHHTCKIII